MTKPPMDISEKELNSLMDELLDTSKGIINNVESIPAIFFIVLDRNAVRIAPPELLKNMQIPENIDDKSPILVQFLAPHDDWHQDIREMGFAVKIPVAAVICLSEAWSSVQNGKVPHTQPSKDPNRMEIFNLCGMTIGGETIMKTYNLERENGLLRLGAQRLEGGSLEGTSGRAGGVKVEANILKQFFIGHMEGLLRTFMNGDKNKVHGNNN